LILEFLGYGLAISAGSPGSPGEGLGRRLAEERP
jgi:hypothetical protein